MKSNDELMDRLLSLPGITSDQAKSAFNDLLAAAERYKATKMLVDEEGRSARPSLADARAGLRSLQATLLDAENAVKHLPPNAVLIFGRYYGAPLGKILGEMRGAAVAADEALRSYDGQPNRTKDYERDVLALDVAIVFRDILKIKAATTVDTDENITGTHGGAAYSRILRATLKVAGIESLDIKPVINAGLRLLMTCTPRLVRR